MTMGTARRPVRDRVEWVKLSNPLGWQATIRGVRCSVRRSPDICSLYPWQLTMERPAGLETSDHPTFWDAKLHAEVMA